MSIGTYDQCSNDTGTGYTSGDTGCRWINGNLQSNNSIYYEGDATVQRVWLTGFVPGSTHTLTLKYGTTKGGKHAYDFLTTWDWSEDWVTAADRCEGIGGCEAAATESKLDIPQDPNAPDSFEPSAPGDRQFVMRGGNLSKATTPAIVSGDYSGDSETVTTLTFTVASSGDMCPATGSDKGTCGVALWFGAHVAAQANWGLGLGAGSISGSPYHVALDAVDNASVGQRDNQMQANVVTFIPNGTIVIVKDVDPGTSEQDFSFNLNNNSTINQNFKLDDDSDPTLPASQTFSVPPGTWYASEVLSGLPRGWTLSNLVCVDPTSNTTTDFPAGSKATINLAPSETVTCTYTNTYNSQIDFGNILVKKVTSNNDSDTIFTFDPSWSGTNFTLKNGATPEDSGLIAPGTYSVKEVNIPTGWALTSAVCKDKDGNESPVTAIDLGINETVTCTFTNSRVYDDLTVSKTATPSFTRTYAWDITKEVDETTADIPNGSSATFNYRVGVTHDDGTDSAFAVSGVITVHNPNTFAVSGVDVTDAAPGGTCTVKSGTNLTVPAGGDATANYSCTFTSNPGSDTNTATATWDALTYATLSGTASGTADFDFAGVTPTVVNGSVTVTDTLGGNLGTVSYTDASPKTFTYSKSFAGVAGTCTKYDNTATISENGKFAKKIVEVCVGKDLIVSKTAAGTFDRSYLWRISKDVDQTLVKIADGGSYTFHYTVNVEQTGISDTGWTLSGKITLTNPNDWQDITLTGLTDVVDNGGTCTVDPGPYKVLAGKTLDVNYSCSYASAPNSFSGTNTAIATWDKAAAFTPNNSASGSAPFTQSQLGATNKTVHVTDSYGGDLGTVTATDGAPFAKGTFTYDRTESGVAGNCTKYDNTATITETNQTASKTVTLCVGKDLTVTKTATASKSRTYKWLIDKTVDKTKIDIPDDGTATFNYSVKVTPDGYTDSGYTLGGSIIIANPNDWQDVTVDVADTLDTGGTCSINEAAPYVVKANDSLTLHYTCTTDGTTTKNTATVSWDKAAYHTPNASASADAAVSFGVSGETNRTITVIDDKTDPLNPVTLGAADFFVGPFTFTYSLDKKGVAGKCTDYTNTAVIDKTDKSDSQEVTVCVGKDLTVTKTATPWFTRTWDWKITKAYDGTYDLFAGATVSHGYEVTVTPTSKDSGWVVNGKITVTNPNDWEVITANVTDVVDNGGTCTVYGSPVDVPANGSVALDYTCTWGEEAPSSASGRNVATASWDKTTFFTPNASASGGADFTFSEPTTTVNPVITVDDDNLTGEIWSADRAYAEWTYTKDFTCSADPAEYTDGKYSFDLTNTAKINETGQTDTATVDVNCYAPKVVKSAATYWNRDWDWTITKDYDGSYNLFAGDTVTHGYKVSVDPTYTDNFWGVKGSITVSNAHPTEDMTLTSLTDLVGDIAGVVTCESLVVPAKGSLTCSYDTGKQNSPDENPFGDLNTATAVFAGANWTGTAPFGFSATPTTEDEPIITVGDDNLTGEDWSADRSDAEWTYNKDFACSTNPDDYTGGKYSFSHTNTATINETGQKDTATVGVTCYWPQIELTKTGDTLSKIGDDVYYDVTVFNNTPTDAGLRAMSCTISDPTIGFNKKVELASGAKDESLDIKFTIPAGASDPFTNTASVTCKPVAATAPVVGSSTFSVSDSSGWSTNLFQPAVEIVKTGPAYATSGDVITYTFTINNKSSSDSPNLMIDSVSDDVLGDLEAAALDAGCDNLVYNGTCTFTAKYTIPNVGLQPTKITNIVTLHYHPDGFPNDITDTDDHAVVVSPRSQLTDTSFCPLPNNQFRLLYHLEVAPNIYRLQASNPGQYYMNGFYFGAPGSDFTMTLQIPYPFITQEGAGVPIQVHDGTSLTSSGCYSPNPMLSGYTIATQAQTPVSSAGNQIITPEDYTTKQLGQYTTVTVSGKVPATGMAYVTIHLDYGLKKTGSWKQAGTYTTNPVSGASIADVLNQTGFGSGAVTIKGFQPYEFARTVGIDTATTTPSSYNEFKKFAGFLGFVTSKATGQPVGNSKVTIYDPTNKLLTTQYTDVDGYYMYAYKHTAKSATYTVKLPAYNKSTAISVKANGFAPVDFEIP
jgi:hypothetical protein